MRFGGGTHRIWHNKGDSTQIYEAAIEDPVLLNKKYPPLQRPDNAFVRLSKKQKVVSDLFDIGHIERELQKCLQESTTHRLYQPSEQVSLAMQKEFRTKFVRKSFLFLHFYFQIQTQELFKSYPGLFPKELSLAKAPLKTQLTIDQKRHRQARHVLERVKKESSGKQATNSKKTVAMLQSKYTPSEAKNGVIYITFDESGAAIDNVAKDLQEVKVKKEKTAPAVLDESADVVASVIGSEDEHSEVVFAEENEYENDNDDDFGAINVDDE